MRNRGAVAAISVTATLIALCGVPIRGQIVLHGLDPRELEPLRAVLALEAPVPDVCSAAPLMVGGRPAIVASVSYSRRFCADVFVIGRGPRPAFLQHFHSWWLQDMRHALADLDGDGVAELILSRLSSNYESGPQCTAAVPIVYSCAGQACREASGEFPAFYREQIRRRDVARATLSPRPASSDDYDYYCETIERDAMLRISGVDATAGFDEANAWLANADANIRRKAVSVLGAIGDAASRARLSALSADPDEWVREQALAALRRP
jgi:hypothetical protein